MLFILIKKILYLIITGLLCYRFSVRASGLDRGALPAAFVLSFFTLSCNYTKRYLYRYRHRRSRCANISDRGWNTHHSAVRMVKIIYAEV